MSRVTLLRIALIALGLIWTAAASAAPVYRGYAYDYASGRYVPAPYVPPPVAIYAVPAVPAYPAPPPAAYAVPPPVSVVPAPPPPLPQGWVYARPANCGVYKYWNGTECLDARYDPPPLGD